MSGAAPAANRPGRPRQRVASAPMRDPSRAPRAASRGAARASPSARCVLRLVAAVGFANYDTLYALAWGGQLSRGSTPAYGVAIAPTPHPLLELLGLVLAPLGPRAVENVTVALGFLALISLRLGHLPARRRMVRLGRRRARCADLPHPRRKCSPTACAPTSTCPTCCSCSARCSSSRATDEQRRPSRRARARAARARRAAAPRGVGVLRAVLAVSLGSRARRLAAPQANQRRAPRDASGRTRRDVVRLTLLAAAAPLDLGAQRSSDHRRPAVVADTTPSTPPQRSVARPASPTCPSTSRGGSARSCARPCSSPPRSAVCCRCCGCAARAARRARRRDRRGRVRRLRHGRAADQHPLRVPRLRHPVHLRRRRRLRLAAPAARRSAAALVDGRRRARARRAARLRTIRSTAPPTANCAELARRTKSKTNCSRSSTTTPSTCAAGRSACPTMRPCRCSRCISKRARETSSAPKPGTSPPAYTSIPASKEVEKDYVLDTRDPVEKHVSVPPGFTESATNRSWLIFQGCR